jgi:ATPase subunit of ABC transporter with duplicated ATPase domains
VEALAGALGQFPGAIVFASHDRFLIDSLADHRISLGVRQEADWWLSS